MAFIDESELGVMETLGGHRAPHCDKHHFRAKMTVSILKQLLNIPYSLDITPPSFINSHINCLTLGPLRL